MLPHSRAKETRTTIIAPQIQSLIFFPESSQIADAILRVWRAPSPPCRRCFSKIHFAVILNRGEDAHMSLTERIQKELTAAMKERDELRLSVLRMMKTALKNKEIEKMRPLEDLESLQILQTMVKQRRESVEQFTKGGRDDLAAKEAQEIKIIESYLPAAPTDAEISRAIEEAVADTEADSLKQMGAVIKAARAKLEGKTVDGKVLSDRVRERLSR